MYRVVDLGFEGLGIRALGQDAGFKVQSSGFRVWEIREYLEGQEDLTLT